MFSQGRDATAGVKHYLDQREEEDLDVIVYGIRDTDQGPRVTTPSEDLTPEHGVDYGIVLQTDEAQYNTDIETFADDLFEEPEELSIDRIEETLESYNLNPETILLNGDDPELTNQLEEKAVEETYNLWNPIHSVKYLATQMHRIDERKNNLWPLSPEKSRELWRRRNAAVVGPTSVMATQIGAAALVAPDNPELAVGLGASGVTTYSYSSGVAGKYLERVLGKERYQEHPDTSHS